MDRDEIRALREFAAFTWFIGMLYHAGDGDIHTGVRRVYAHYVWLHQQRRSTEELIPARYPDGVEWRTRALHGALRAVAQPPYRDAMGMMLTRLFQSPANRLGGAESRRHGGEGARMRGPGRSVRARLVAAEHEEAERHREAKSSQHCNDDTIDLTDSTDTAEAVSAGQISGGAKAPERELNASVARIEPPPLELTDSDLQRIDESVNDARAAGSTQK